MPAEVLSLDLDWFNLYETNLKENIRHFFRDLNAACTLPKHIDLVPEHQYLYPWSLKVMESKSYRKVNVVNVDQHHDFYRLHKIDFQDEEEAVVGCWNFFAFMAHRKFLGEYKWVTNQTGSKVKRQTQRLWKNISRANSSKVRVYKNKIRIFDAYNVFSVLQGKKFDGFIIVRSPEYTKKYRSVYHAVDEALDKELSKHNVRRYSCRSNFINGKVEHQANLLFQNL